MYIAITLPVAGMFHQGCRGVSKVQWHGLSGSFHCIGNGCVVGEFYGIGFRSVSKIDRGLREREQSFGQANKLNDLGSRRSLDHCLWIGQANVFRGQYAQAARDEYRIGATFY